MLQSEKSRPEVKWPPEQCAEAGSTAARVTSLPGVPLLRILCLGQAINDGKFEHNERKPGTTTVIQLGFVYHK